MECKNSLEDLFMDRYCIFCGAPLVGDGPCPCISKYAKTAPGTNSSPKTMVQRQADVTPVDEAETIDWEAWPDKKATEPSKGRKPVFFDYDAEEPEPNSAAQPPKPLDEVKFTQEEKEQNLDPRTEEQSSRGSFSDVLRSIPSFLCAYCADYLPYGRNLARTGDLRYGLAFMLLSLALSGGSTVIYGIFHLEEFFLRWYVAGIMTPVICFAASFAYILAVMGGARNSASAKSIMVTVGLSSVFPSVLQFCSLILSTLDGDGKVFQFFALLILLTWLFSLFSLTFSIYRVKIGLGTLLLSVAFSFLAIVIIRAVWIWFLTGYSNFAFYLPSSLYPGELYEAFAS